MSTSYKATIGIWLVAVSLGGCQGGAPVTPAAGTAGEGVGMPQVPVTDTVTEGDLDVRLEAVARPHPVIVRTDRNPFRFGQSSQGDPIAKDFDADGAPEQPVVVVGDRPGASGSTLPQGLRFIGLVEAPSSAGQIAVLSDGDTVFHGRVGETVDGRYRITRIGIDSVEVERLAGGVRQVLRLASR